MKKVLLGLLILTASFNAFSATIKADAGDIHYYYLDEGRPIANMGGDIVSAAIDFFVDGYGYDYTSYCYQGNSREALKLITTLTEASFGPKNTWGRDVIIKRLAHDAYQVVLTKKDSSGETIKIKPFTQCE